MAENRLTEVAHHWLPRMEVAGIPSSLARSLIDASGTWDNWCRTWAGEAARQEELADAALKAGRKFTAGESYARAALLYHFAQFMFFDDLAQKDAAAVLRSAAHRKAAPLLAPPADALEVPFEGATLRAMHRRPGNWSGKTALLIPGSDSTKEEFPALELHFLNRGVATVSLDGPGQGEGRSFGALRPDITSAVQATVDYLSGTGRATGGIALVGMAFGGNLALRAAAGVPEIAAVVSINGFHDLGAMWDAFPAVYRDNMRYALAGKDDADTRQKAQGFTLSQSRPRAVPTLILHGGLDRIFPVDQARAQADWAGERAELTVYPGGNHVCNNLSHIYRPLVADWVAENV